MFLSAQRFSGTSNVKDKTINMLTMVDVELNLNELKNKHET